MSKSTEKGLLDFLASGASPLPEEVVHIEQWGRDVTLRGMTSRERDLFEENQLQRANRTGTNGAGTAASRQLQADLTNFRARLVARHIVENGMRTFANPRGEEVLGDQPAAILDKLFSVSQKLSGFSQQDVEVLVKNSGPIPEDEHSSDSLGSQDEQSENSKPASAPVN